MAEDHSNPTSIEQMRAEFRQQLADTARTNAEARKLDSEGYKAWQEGRFYPFVVFGAGSIFTVILGAVIAALLKWAGVP